MTRARRIATGAAYGTGGLSALGAVTVGVLWGEAALARRVIGEVDTPPPAVDGDYGAPGGEPLRLAVLGDSAAAGWGVTPSEAFPAVLAELLAGATGRPVRLRCRAVVGAQASDLLAQCADADAADLTVIIVGANDITHRVSRRESTERLSETVYAVRATGSQVLVGTCPDLGTIRPVKHPLRLLLRHTSRRLADAQTVAAVAAGAVSVSLRDLLGEEFDIQPGEMFHADRFHPSALGYRRIAEAVLPGALVALGLEADAPHVTAADAAAP